MCMDTNKTSQNSIESNRNRILTTFTNEKKKPSENNERWKNWMRIDKKLTQTKASHMEENLVPKQTS